MQVPHLHFSTYEYIWTALNSFLKNNHYVLYHPLFRLILTGCNLSFLTQKLALDHICNMQ